MTPTADVLYRIKRGLPGYVSYLAACEMNEAFSEYVLYEPILRILTARGYSVTCESECPGFKRKQGDKKKIDFVARGHQTRFALEVKWARSRSINVRRDVEKLVAFEAHYPASRSFLCVFGRQSKLESIAMRGIPKGAEYWERGNPVVADLRKTRFACRVFEFSSI